MMTQDEIIELARQAGMMTRVLYLGRNLELLEVFAKLVAEKEREACAKLAENRFLLDGSEKAKNGHHHTCKQIATDIRSRGQA
jgi:hypothetical protein